MEQTEQAGVVYLTRQEASDYTGLPLRTLDRYASQGLITRYKLGGRQWVRFARPELDDMLKRLARPLPDPNTGSLPVLATSASASQE